MKTLFGLCNPFWWCLKHTNICFFTLKLSLAQLKSQKKNKISSAFTGKIGLYLWFFFCYKGHSMEKCLELNLLNCICNFLLCCLGQWLVNTTKSSVFLKLFLLNRNIHLLRFSLQLLGTSTMSVLKSSNFQKERIFKI